MCSIWIIPCLRDGTQNHTKTVKRTYLKYNKQHLDNIEQYDLAMVKNVNRSTDTWDLLEKLEQGKLNKVLSNHIELNIST